MKLAIKITSTLCLLALLAATVLATQSTPTYPLHAPIDLGGKTITIGARWENEAPYLWSTQTPPAPDSVHSRSFSLAYQHIAQVKQDFNISIQYLELPEEAFLPTLKLAHLAGEPLVDMMYLSNLHALEAAHHGLLMPLDAIALAGSDLLGEGRYARTALEVFGHPQTFTTSQLSASGLSLGVNLDILEAIGGADPLQLYESGNWDWDHFYVLMSLAARYGYDGITGVFQDLMMPLIASNDGALTTEAFIFDVGQSSTVAALEFFQHLAASGLYRYHAQGDFDWWANYYAFEDGGSLFFPIHAFALTEGTGFDFMVLPWPVGPDNTSGNTWMGTPYAGLAFPAHAPHASEVLMVVEEIFSWPQGDMDMFNDFRRSWLGSFLPTAGDVERKLGLSHTQAVDVGLIVPGYWGMMRNFGGHLVLGTYSIDEVIAQYRDYYQAMLDQFFAR